MNQLKEQQKLIRELSPQYLALYPVLGKKEAVTVPHPTRQITLPETSTKPCAECTEETLVSDLTDNGHGFKVCPKCYVPDEDEQEDDPFMKRAYDAHNDRWIYE